MFDSASGIAETSHKILIRQITMSSYVEVPDFSEKELSCSLFQKHFVKKTGKIMFRSICKWLFLDIRRYQFSTFHY